MNSNAIKKRKFSHSKEYERNQSTSCLGGCCTRKKVKIQTINSLKVSKEKNVKLTSAPDENILNIPSMIHWELSPLYHEYTFCQKTFESSYDPCIECNVQNGPDNWENIPRLRKLVDEKNECMTIERFDMFLDRAFGHDDIDSISGNEALKPLKNNVNSFVNDIIGDGVDRISELIAMTSTHHNRENDLQIDNKLAINSETIPQPNESNKEFIKDQSDLDKHQQNLSFNKAHEYPGLVFEKQNLKKTSQMSSPLSVQLSLDKPSSHVVQDDLKSNMDQQKAVDQESYNWDYQEYQWPPSSLDLSQQDCSVDNPSNDHPKKTVMNDILSSDDDSTDLSYSIASVLPSNRAKNAQSRTNDLKNPTSSVSIPNQQQAFSASPQSESVDRLPYDENINERNQQKMHRDSSESQDSLSNASEHSTPSSNAKLNHNNPQAVNSSESDANNNVTIPSIHNDKSPSKDIRNSDEQQPSFNDTKPRLSFEVHDQRENDRFSATSVSDLLKQISQIREQKSFDIDSVSTAYSIPISARPSVLPDVVTNKHERSHSQLPRTTSTEKHPPGSSNLDTNQQEGPMNIDKKDQDGTIKHTQSNIPDKQKRAVLSSKIDNRTDETDRNPSRTVLDNTVNQVRSTYDDIMNSWRHLLERLLTFMLPPIDNTDNNVNLSSSIFTSNTHSWSTLIPIETINMNQSDNTGPWWGRRDAYDRTPSTFIFANEPLRTWYFIETMTRNKQMGISTENRPFCAKYYSCPNTCCCYYGSPITINNSSSFS